MVASPTAGLGTRIALGAGVLALGGAIAVIAFGGERLIAVVLALVGASALAGWSKARRAGDRSSPPS